MGALPVQWQYAVRHSYAYITLPTPQDEKWFVARNAVGCHMYMQIHGTKLKCLSSGVRAASWSLLVPHQSPLKAQSVFHGPEYTQLRNHLADINKANYIYHRQFVDTMPFIDRFIYNYA
jgi:hypothetical protein